MNREERLRRELAGTGLEHRAGELATLPVGQIDLIVAGLRASHRQGREFETGIRRRRRENRRKYGWVEDSDYGDAAARFLDGLGRRAGANLEALGALHAILREGRALLSLAVAGARAAGYSDSAIGLALGHPYDSARSAVGQRFGPRGARAGGERLTGAGPMPSTPRGGQDDSCQGDVDSRPPDTAGGSSCEDRPPSGPLEAAQRPRGAGAP